MASFSYKVRDGGGDLVTGMIDAATMAEAGSILRSQGKFIVKLAESTRGRTTDTIDTTELKHSGKIKRAQVITFAHQLSVMVDTGVPISEALHSIAEQCESAPFKAVLQDVGRRVESGDTLSSAMSAHRKVFPPIMISLVRASELSGTMGVMLERVSKYLSKEYQTVKKIKGALTYPAVMLVMIVMVTVGLLVWVLPRFAGIFESKGAALPLPTVMLMALSDTLMYGWYYWLGGVVAAATFVYVGLRTEAGRRVFDRMKLSMPILGSLFSKLYVTRSTRTMGTMINAGVPILDMIAIVRDVTTNRLYEDLWDEADDRLQQGSQLSDVLFASKLIPRSVAQMVYAGEKSGRLGETMEKIASFTEEEFDEQIKTTTNLIEPLMVAIMGGIVGFVAIALLLPIFSVSSVVGGG